MTVTAAALRRKSESQTASRALRNEHDRNQEKEKEMSHQQRYEQLTQVLMLSFTYFSALNRGIQNLHLIS